LEEGHNREKNIDDMTGLRRLVSTLHPRLLIVTSLKDSLSGLGWTTEREIAMQLRLWWGKVQLTLD